MHSHKGFAKLDEDGVGGTAAAAAGSVTTSSAADGVGGVQGAGSQGSLVGSSNGGGSASGVIGGALSKLSHRGGRAPVPQSEDGEAGAAKPHHPRNALETSAEATVSGSVFNAVNNIIGAGLLSLPWTMRQNGMLLGILCLVFVAAVNILSLALIGKCCDMANSFSYKDMGKRALGKTTGYIVQGVVAGYTLGSTVSYIVLIGDFFPHVLSQWAPGFPLFTRNWSVILISIFVLFPLSFLRDLNKLRFTSFAALLCILYAMLVVVLECLMVGRRSDSTHVVEASNGVWAAFPIINVSFTLHYNGPRYYQELKTRSIPKFLKVMVIAFGICTAVYAATAITGYIMFGGDTEGDILNNFEDDDLPALIARLSLAFVIIFTYPLAFHSLRSSVFAIGPASWRKSTSKLLYGGITAALLLATVLTGMLFEKVEVVLGYKGAVFGGCIVYIFPAIMYASLRGQQLRAEARAGAVASTASAAHLPPGDDDAHAEAEGQAAAAPGTRPRSLSQGREKRLYNAVVAAGGGGGEDEEDEEGAGGGAGRRHRGSVSSYLTDGSELGDIELTEIDIGDHNGGSRPNGGIVGLGSADVAAAASSQARGGRGDMEAGPGMPKDMLSASQESARYLWRSAVLFFCTPSWEAAVCAFLLIWGIVMAVLGVLVTSGAIKGEK